MDIVITGAAGFIGSTLANKLSCNDDYNLILIDSLIHGDIDNLNLEIKDKLIVIDCMDLSILRKIVPKKAIIFHFAGLSSLPECESDFSGAIRNNFLSLVNISQVSYENDCKKLIFASTSAVYENNNEKEFSEDIDVNPDLFYSYSKYLSENHLKILSKKVINFEIVICRFFNVFGYKQDIKRENPPLTAYLLKCLKSNTQAIIYNDNPKIKRDYIFIDDLVQGLYNLLSTKMSSNYECINFTSGLDYSVGDIIQIIRDEFSLDFSYKFEEPTKIWNTYPNLSKFLNENRIEKEVYKNSHGSNDKLKNILSVDFEFTNMSSGLKKMFNHT